MCDEVLKKEINNEIDNALSLIMQKYKITFTNNLKWSYNKDLYDLYK